MQAACRWRAGGGPPPTPFPQAKFDTFDKKKILPEITKVKPAVAALVEVAAEQEDAAIVETGQGLPAEQLQAEETPQPSEISPAAESQPVQESLADRMRREQAERAAAAEAARSKSTQVAPEPVVVTAQPVAVEAELVPREKTLVEKLSQGARG